MTSVCQELSSAFDSSKPNAKRSRALLGGLMQFLAYGGISTWGTVNIYYASYYIPTDPISFLNISSIMIALLGLPMGISAIYSIRIAEKFGFKRVSIIGSVIYSGGLVICSFSRSFYVFVFFYLILSHLSACFCFTPIIHQIWLHFPSKKGEVSGLMFGIFALSGLLFVPMATTIVNPSNKSASISQAYGGAEYKFFPEEVTNNVPKMFLVIGAFYFILTFAGAVLLDPPHKSVPEQRELLLKREENIDQDGASVRNMEEKSCSKDEVLEDARASRQCPSFKEGLLSRPFKIIFFNAFFTASFSLFLSLNFKTYGLLKVNNDFFITFLSFLNGVSSALGRLFWGYFLDRCRFKTLYMGLQITIATFSITFTWISSENSVFFGLWIFIMAFIEGGLICILGPGLCKIFGITVGPQLYPVKTLTFYIALIVIPLFQFFTLNYFTLDTLFLILAVWNCLGVISAIFLNDRHRWVTAPAEAEKC